MDLADRVRLGVEALRRGEFAVAADVLGAARDDAAWAAADDVADLRARVASLYAQALLGAGRIDEADRAVVDALRLVKPLGDATALAEVRALQGEIVKARVEARQREAEAAERRRVADTPVDELLAGVADPDRQAALLNQKATAEIDLGRTKSGEALARRALALATSPREQVFARLAIARTAPREATEQIEAAWACASDANEFNLVAIIARTAELLGVTVARLEGAGR